MYLCSLEIQVSDLAGPESCPVPVGWKGPVFSLRAPCFPEAFSMGPEPKRLGLCSRSAIARVLSGPRALTIK